jgi:hypothetical protein
MRTLRDYQLDAIAAVNREWARVASTMIVMPTGTGKTVVMAKIVADFKDKNILLLAHRNELLLQAQEKFGAELGYLPPIEKAEQGVDPYDLWQDGLVLLASVPTLRNDKRLRKFERRPFDYILIDECFPAGTMIGETPIERIAVGDVITSFDERTRELKQGKVVRTFQRPCPSRLVRITAAGRSVVCTENHPFYTSRGWVRSGLLEIGELLAVDSELLNDFDLYGMSVGFHSNQESTECVDSSGQDKMLLLADVQQDLQRKAFLGENGQNQSEVCFGPDEGQESHAASGDPGESVFCS